ncbi:general amidase [Aspergillus sclerotiicarbonarius CBS 121057]|uniref:General amidase n=1 Tax=Aspergillus sclerotiicarbonarius (strain CBS 121057 / IBT 28362) TaxID=1448318 RepID=A0A319EME5_ASPSB|nr:general amidase [Aspergillus sclerotiicarbonarius CBS 121057]
MTEPRTLTWEEQASKTQTGLWNKIPKEWHLSKDILEHQHRNILPQIESAGILSPHEISITRHEDATTLLSKIHSGVLSAEEVTVAFCKRAAIAHQLVNCLMDVDFDAAVARARELDQYLRASGQVVGPLHGLPISIKDLTAVKDLHYSMGYVSWAENVATNDCVVVDTLRAAGAVIYAKTTMPQSGMCLETTSNLFGRTLNPFNTSLTPGGSSGGESALLACRGSILGIGGSIRIPAAFTGLYSLKPTSRRVSYKGNMNNSSGLGISSSIGPMGHSVRDLELAMRVLVDGRHWVKDSAVFEKPWTKSILSEPARKLCIGLVEWDEQVMPHPPIRRALRITEEKLIAAGHEVIRVKAYRHRDGEEIARRLFYQLGTTFISDELSKTDEPPIKAIEKKIGREPGSLADVANSRRQCEAYKDGYLGWWNATAEKSSSKQPIDALLLPAGGSTSFPHDFVPTWNYVTIYNFIDYPCMKIPITTVDRAVDVKDGQYVPVSEQDGVNYRLYDPEVFDGMPVCLQLVGRPFGEEALLSVGSVVDGVVRGN